MSVSVREDAFVVSGGQTINLASMFGVTAGANDPTYLVLTGLDRNEYTVTASGATGSLSGDGAVDHFASLGGDSRGAGVVFTYDPASGRYTNATYGYLDQMTYTASTSSGDVTNLSLFASNNLSQASIYKNSAYSMLQTDDAGYLGSVTVVTQPAVAAIVPAQATPDSIAQVAMSFVAKAWNDNGCWTLVGTIAAEAGASLPVDSSFIGMPGHANGEWFVAFDGTQQTGNWQSMVKAGEIVVIGNSTGGGHITTCVSGSGSTAMLVDNITYVNSSGAIVNLANDGSSYDVVIAAPHLASQEWAGVAASSVKIYELDTPTVSTLVTVDKVAIGASQLLSQLFSAADPLGKAVTEYQVYDTAGSDAFTVNGVIQAAHSAAQALTVGSLSSICLATGLTACTDTLEVRAFNGSYWGDWQALTAQVAAPANSGPVVVNQTANQVWSPGHSVYFTLPGSTFIDPSGQPLKYTAYQIAGPSVTSWLSFYPPTDTFFGFVPAHASGTVTLEVVAKDAGGLTATDIFNVTLGKTATGFVGVLTTGVQAPEVFHN
jgi:hypothetical protein